MTIDYTEGYTLETFPGYDLDTLKQARSGPFLQAWEGVACSSEWVARAKWGIGAGWDYRGQPTTREGSIEAVRPAIRRWRGLLKGCHDYFQRTAHAGESELTVDHKTETKVHFALAFATHPIRFSTRRLYHDSFVADNDRLLAVYNPEIGLGTFVVVVRDEIVMAAIRAESTSTAELEDALYRGLVPRISSDYSPGEGA
jgi:hypothetical protein